MPTPSPRKSVRLAMALLLVGTLGILMGCPMDKSGAVSQGPTTEAVLDTHPAKQYLLPPNERVVAANVGSVPTSIQIVTRPMRPDETPEQYKIYQGTETSQANLLYIVQEQGRDKPTACTTSRQ